MTPPLRLLAMLLPLTVPFAAHADKLPLPADAPPAFLGECASCHIAFPPKLMVAEDWKRVMALLNRHYGDNASLDEQTRRTIEDFLTRNAGKATKNGTTGTASATEPPRLTGTPWFKRKHHEVPGTDWTDPKVKSAANCTACHTKALEGSYREREIVMPGGRRWKS